MTPGSGSTKAAGDEVKVSETPAASGDGDANSHSDVKSDALQHTPLYLLLKRPESSEATNLCGVESRVRSVSIER